VAKYRIVINRERCVGDGLCREAADGVFRIDRELCSSVRDAEANTPADVLYAAWNCPNRCITLFETETGRQAWPGVLSREQFEEVMRRREWDLDPGAWALWREHGGTG